MKTMPVGELKTRFSAVLDAVRKGEKIAISVIVPYAHYMTIG